MDLLDSKAGSSESDDERELPALADARGQLHVGHKVMLKGFSGKCIGDDMTWRGTEATDSQPCKLQGQVETELRGVNSGLKVWLRWERMLGLSRRRACGRMGT